MGIIKTNSTVQGVAAFGGAAVGAYFGGQTGMMIGMSLASLLIEVEDAGEAHIYNDEHKATNTITNADPVPVMVGTDLAPGKPIYLNVATSTFVEPKYYQNDALNAMLRKVIREVDLKFRHIEWIANFAEDGSINRIWMDHIHEWCWIRFDDYMHFRHDWRNIDYNILSRIWIENFDSGRNTVDTNPESSWTPHGDYHSYANMRFWGMFNTPKPHTATLLAYQDLPEDSEADLVKRMNLAGSIAQTFPDLKAELSYNTRYTPYSGKSQYAFNSYDHTYRDNRSHYMYGVLNADSFLDDRFEDYYQAYVDIQLIDLYTYEATRLCTKQYAWDNITTGYNRSSSNSISRQDIDEYPDRLYIMHFRNWYYAGKWDHHHAAYSFKYDMFYIDRSDNTVHSVTKDQQVNLPGWDFSRFSESNPCPTFYPASMEIVGNEILVFGHEWQTHSIWDDEFEIISFVKDVATNSTKIYADFSRYPDNYWVRNTTEYTGILPSGCWAWTSSGGNTIRIRYRIVEQTSTYIVVEGVWPFDFNEGGTLYVSRVRDIKQTNWAIVGEGSTTSEIIVQEQFPFEPRLFTGMQYDSVQFADTISTGDAYWGWEIQSMSTTKTTLVDTLTRTPVAGEVIYFTWEDHDNVYSHNYNIYYNPYNYMFTPNLSPHWDKSQYEWTGDFYSFAGAPSYYFNNGFVNKKYYGRYDILRFNKTTGAYIGRMASEPMYGYSYTGLQRLCVIEAASVATVSTDAQVAVAFKNVGPWVHTRCHNMIIDKATLTVIDERDSYHHDGNAFTDGLLNWSHAAGKDWRGAIKVKVFDPDTATYKKKWYVLVNEFTPKKSLYGNELIGTEDINENIGTYLLDLGETGIFPSMWSWLSNDKGAWSSVLNADANLDGGIKWSRHQIVTGPLASYYFSHKNSTRDSQYLRVYDYDEKIFFSHEHGQVWCYRKPVESDLYGYSWPTRMLGGMTNTVRSSMYYLQISSYAGVNRDSMISNYVDAKIYWSLLQFSDFHCRLTMETEESDYADEIIEDVVSMNGEEINIREPRFLYSRTFSQRTPVRTIIKDLAATCQGMIHRSYFSGLKNYLCLKLPRPDEPVIWYFGYDKQTFTTTSNALDYDRILIDLSDYPDDYWKGDIGTITYLADGSVHEFYVKGHTSTELNTVSNIPSLGQAGDTVVLTKDNMKEGSFTFAKKPQFDRSNQIRVEYMNRYSNYSIEIAEANNHYKQEVKDERVIQRQVQLHGIKRATQASRMALRYLDYESFVEWMCTFQTDFLGHYIAITDIIAITHPVTGWQAKKFRVISMDEQEDHETTLECEEYLGSVFHDASEPIFQLSSSGAGSINASYEYPFPVRRLYAFYDETTNRVYVSFYTPQTQPGNFASANIYVSVDGGDYQFMGMSTTVTPSFMYSANPGTNNASTMPSTRVKYNEMFEDGYQYTDIPYEPNSVLGTFPTTGYLWVHGELISYNGIDTTNYKFMNCVRCINVPEYQFATDALADGFNWENPIITLADYINTFSFQVPASWVDLTSEASQTEASEIAYDIPTLSIRVASVGINGLESLEGSQPIYDLQLRYAMGRPLSVSMLEYDRA